MCTYAWKSCGNYQGTYSYIQHLILLSYTYQVCVWVLVAQSCPTLCDPMDCSPPSSFVHGILQARMLQWAAISFSRGSYWPRDWTWVSCIAGRFLTVWVTRETLYLQGPGPDNSEISKDLVFALSGPGLVRKRGLSVQFNHLVVSDSLRPHESQHARPPCPSPTPGVHSDSCPSS